MYLVEANPFAVFQGELTMADFHQPSSAEIRQVLERLPEEPIKVKLGTWSIPMDGLKAKMGFLYEYLIAGRISEVAGKYAPQRMHAIELKVTDERHNVHSEPALMLITKTAKRKTKRGWTLRPATIPMNPRYEPLTIKVYNYIKQFQPREYPFMLAKNPDTSKRYAEAYAKEIFETYHWFFVDYTRSGFADPSTGYTYDKTRGEKRKNISQDEFNAWGAKVSYDKVDDWVPISVSVEGRWKDVNTHEFRKQRLRDLERPYYLEGTDQNIYAGWETKGRDTAAASRHYLNRPELQLDIDEYPENIRTLAEMSKRYFYRLLIPIENLLDSDNMEIGGIEIVG